jgi:hypothetical protein
MSAMRNGTRTLVILSAAVAVATAATGCQEPPGEGEGRRAEAAGAAPQQASAPKPGVELSQRAVGSSAIFVKMVDSAAAGLESFGPGSSETGRQHGGGWTAIYTDEEAGGLAIGLSFRGVALTSDHSSVPGPGKVRRRWWVPANMLGTSGAAIASVHFPDGGHSNTLWIHGNASCQNRCGGQAPAGCFCDSACHDFGDCCGDKIPFCGGRPGQCTCNPDCDLLGNCCQFCF